MVDIIADIPKTSISEDLFGRESLVDLVSSSILQLVSHYHPSTCYAVYGQWGEGKTSFLNFVEEDLTCREKSDNVLVAHYSPWMVGNERALIEEFFRIIASITDGRLRTFLKKYGRVLALTSRNVLDVVKPGLGGKIHSSIVEYGEAIRGRRDPLEIKKKKVSAAIEKSGKHILIFIDDIDRLDKEEVHAVFRLVRQIADFPNMIYFLSMDPNIVSKSLGEYFGDNPLDGRNYIDKIVQVPIILPVISEDRLKSVLAEKMRGLFPVETIEDSDLNELVDEIFDIISSPRQVIRYINQLSFLLPLIDEVSIHDLCVLEAIKVFNLEIYLSIYQHRKALLREHESFKYVLNREEETKQLEESFEKALNEIVGIEQLQSGVKQRIKKSIKGLFSNTYITDIEMLERRCIQSSLYFPIYFIQSVPEGLIPNREVCSFITELDTLDEQHLVEKINEIIDKYSWDNLQRAVLLAFRRNRNNDCRIILRKICVAISLSNITINYPTYSFLQAKSSGFIFQLLNRYSLKGYNDDLEYDYDDDCVATILTDIFERADFNFSMELNAFVQHSYHKMNNLPASHIEPLVSRFCKLSYQEQNQYSKYLLLGYFGGWKRFDSNGPIGYLRKALLFDDFNPASFLLKFIDPDKQELQQLYDFISIFPDEELLSSFISKVECGLLTEKQERSLNIFSSNFDGVLKRFRESKQ